MSGSFPSRIGRLLRTAEAPGWATPVILTMGLASAVLEGTGLYLFIPVVQSLGTNSGDGAGLSAFFARLLAPIPDGLRIPVLMGGLCASIALKNAVGQLNQYVTSYVNGLVAHQLRTRVLRQTVESCIDYRIENRRTDIVNTIATNTWTVASALTQTHRLVVCACTIGVFALLLLQISTWLTAIAAVFLAAGAVIVSLATRRAQTVGEQVTNENNAFGLRMWESISGLRLIRSFSREQHEIKRFEQASENLRRRILRMELLWAVPAPLSEISGAILIATLILAGSRLGVGVPALAAFLVLLYRMQGPVRDLLSARVAFDSNFAAVEDVADYLKRTREPYLKSGAARFRHVDVGVEFRDVSFSYAASDGSALDHVSFVIPRGKTTAIVGPSGAGKSTLMDLLFRFRDPTAGEIRVDGTPLPQFDIASWRSRLSIMSQDVHLFNDTVAANIGYGKAGATPQEIHRAAQIAGAAQFIDTLPQGYDTSLGDEGLRLSGGQRQRIALARTILRDPEILLLDEATNALDNESDRFFQTALRQYARGRTVVVIAHRLSTIEGADQIVMLDGGRVVECGPPAALMAAGGPFARLHGLPAAPAPRPAAV